MAAPSGQYRVQIQYNQDQCDIIPSEEPLDNYGNYIYDFYYDGATTPTVIFSCIPKDGYRITDISGASTDSVLIEIIDTNKVKVTMTDINFSGNADIIVETEEEPITDLNTLFTKIADAIREVDGTTATIPANKFPSRIKNFGGLVSATLTIGTQ